MNDSTSENDIVNDEKVCFIKKHAATSVPDTSQLYFECCDDCRNGKTPDRQSLISNISLDGIRVGAMLQDIGATCYRIADTVEERCDDILLGVVEQHTKTSIMAKMIMNLTTMVITLHKEVIEIMKKAVENPATSVVTASAIDTQGNTWVQLEKRKRVD